MVDIFIKDIILMVGFYNKKLKKNRFWRSFQETLYLRGAK